MVFIFILKSQHDRVGFEMHSFIHLNPDFNRDFLSHLE